MRLNLPARGQVIGLFLMLQIAAPPSFAGTIPVVGLDQNHQPQSVRIPEEQYTGLLRELAGSVSRSTLATLESRDKADLAKETYWMLRDVCVGLGLNFSIGLGPIWSLSAAPRVRFGFSNSTHPKIPD
jgi:hypothetical protein